MKSGVEKQVRVCGGGGGGGENVWKVWFYYCSAKCLFRIENRHINSTAAPCLWKEFPLSLSFKFLLA